MDGHIKEIIYDIVNLRDTTDVAGTIKSIRKSIPIKGYNVWILACAAMLASIGIDKNSDAVIIGAMLISPLMSPILGIGLSVGINDRKHLTLALENFSIAVVASIAVSTIYFAITPLGEINEQILNRIEPDILDVLIALFGGTAGIVAVSRKEITNAIPGVAIATALMPPLCVAGYGIANFRWDIFAGAFYLFFINSVFIALATYLIVRFLRFPYDEFIDEAAKAKAIRWISLFVILILIPSGYFMYNQITKFNKIRKDRTIAEFIETRINTEDRKALDFQFIPTDSINQLRIWMTGSYIDEDSSRVLAGLLNREPYNLGELDLHMIQDLPPLSEDAIQNKTKLETLKRIQPIFNAQQQQLDSLFGMIHIAKRDSLPFSELKNELKILYPTVNKLTVSRAIETDFKGYQDTVFLALIDWDRRERLSTRQRNEKKITDWLKLKMPRDSIKVVGRRAP